MLNCTLLHNINKAKMGNTAIAVLVTAAKEVISLMVTVVVVVLTALA